MVANIVKWSVMVLLPLSAQCASLCEQFFTVQGKSYGTMSVLAYQEQLTGDCEQYRLHLVFINDSLTTSIETEGLSSPPSQMDGFFELFGRERCDTLRDSSGVFIIGYRESCSVPKEDTSFNRKWVDFLRSGGSSSRDWCELYPLECTEYPAFHGVEAALLYKHPGALYRGYSIATSLYYPTSKILVLITHQPRKAVGLDTMHGVLVYRLKSSTGQEP